MPHQFSCSVFLFLKQGIKAQPPQPVPRLPVFRQPEQGNNSVFRPAVYCAGSVNSLQSYGQLFQAHLSVPVRINLVRIARTQGAVHCRCKISCSCIGVFLRAPKPAVLQRTAGGQHLARAVGEPVHAVSAAAADHRAGVAGVQDQGFLTRHVIQDLLQLFRLEVFLTLSVGKQQHHLFFLAKQTVGAQVNQRPVRVVRVPEDILHQLFKAFDRPGPVHIPLYPDFTGKEVRQQRLHRFHVVGACGLGIRHGYKLVAPDQQASGYAVSPGVPDHSQRKQEQAEEKAEQFLPHLSISTYPDSG